MPEVLNTTFLDILSIWLIFFSILAVLVLLLIGIHKIICNQKIMNNEIKVIKLEIESIKNPTLKKQVEQL